ncbi:MAG: methyltransferase domain-containing protein [Actinomycetota bacterium]
MTPEHRSFYEEEARRRTRTTPAGFRVAIRSAFIATLVEQASRSVVDLGAGPGGDGAAFAAAGLRYVGLDLAVGNAGLAREAGLTVVPGSLTAPPFRAGSFDASWSMSTLMHLDEAETLVAVNEIGRLLRPGAPLLVGLWGGTLGDIVSTFVIPEHPRRFCLRELDHNRELLGTLASVERVERRDAGPDGWEYQVLHLRVG